MPVQVYIQILNTELLVRLLDLYSALYSMYTCIFAAQFYIQLCIQCTLV